MQDPRGARSTGPWMLKTYGHWGTGRHALNDFDVVVEDLGRPPDDDDAPGDGSLGAPVARTFLKDIEEDIEPEEGMDVQFDLQILRPRNGSTPHSVIEVSSAE